MGVEALVKKVKPSDVRTELGLTQKELGALSGLSHVTIIRAENGISIQRLSAHAIFKALNKERVTQGLHRLKFEEMDWKIQGED